MKKVLLILVATLICYFSNTPSLKVINPTSWINPPSYEENVKDLSFLMHKDSVFYRSYTLPLNVDFVLHKLAHVTFYSFLTFLLYINLRSFKWKVLFVWCVITIFATTDEIHQFFVIGRSGRAMDVALDSTASLIVVILIALIIRKKRIYFKSDI